MSLFRSYFSKNNCLINGNYTNNANNPAIEISTVDISDKKQSRYIFDINLNNLLNKVNSGLIKQDNVKHYLVMTNTINHAPDRNSINTFEGFLRASSFNLELFNVDEDWDAGSGYDIVYNENKNTPKQASNWYNRKSGVSWTNEGVFVGDIIDTISFDSGSENIRVDITDYINQRLGFTGTPKYSGSSFGLGLKFDDAFESNTSGGLKQFVSFHGKDTNTFYEPYIESLIDDKVYDDRGFFQLDSDNTLYLYLKNIKETDNVLVSNVNIIDNNEQIFESINNITKVKTGLYKINLNISSSDFPDCIILNDEWTFNINGKEIKYSGEFYIQPNELKYVSDNNTSIKNYFFSLLGINENEQICGGEVKKIRLSVRSIYNTKLIDTNLAVEYRVYTKVGKEFELDIIPYTEFNKTIYGYEFDLDTSWLIAQDYFIEVRLTYNEQFIKNKLSFTITQNLFK